VIDFIFRIFISQFVFISFLWAQSPYECSQVFNIAVDDKFNLPKLEKILSKVIVEEELNIGVAKGLANVPELEFVRETAEKLGARVWLFGGTAASFLHYVKWDLERTRGLLVLQKDRFDYDYTNIFRSTQDLDIVVDATPEVAKSFQTIIAEKYPHFLGAKAKWEVRTLRHQSGNYGEVGFKEALLDDPDFNNQNTDSNSLGMVEITSFKNEPRVRDLKYWNKPNSVFLDDTLNNRISFFRSNQHFSTFRARTGENPEILSVIRLLVKAFQYELTISQTDFIELKKIISEFDGSKIQNANALRRIEDTAKKLVMHAVNIEYAMNKLDELGLRQKIIAMGDSGQQDTAAWWLNREPLRSKPIGIGLGKTAAELNISIVAHETKSFLAYESITRAHTGEPNVLISRLNAIGELAAHGDGFYTRRGKEGARGTGLTIRFTVDPKAREGTDFKIIDDFVIFNNKKTLYVIQESLNFGLDDLFRLAESNQHLNIDRSDLALLEKLKRKLNAAKINDELAKLLNSNLEKDQDRLIRILKAFQESGISNLIDKNILSTVIKDIINRISPLRQSTDEKDLLKYFQTMSSIIKASENFGLLSSNDFLLTLESFIFDKAYDFEFRKKLFFILLLDEINFQRSFPRIKRNLLDHELKLLITEVKQWSNSNDPKKIEFLVNLNKSWWQAIEEGFTARIESLSELGLIDINIKNTSQVSILQLAAYYSYGGLMESILKNPDFDINARNQLGNTEVEQLLLIGKTDLARYIKSALRPEAIARNIELKERNDDGTPIIDFIRFEPGSFKMEKNAKKIISTISNPFEIMSVTITNEVYNTVLQLLVEQFPETKFSSIKNFESLDQRENLPKVQVSYNSANLWLEGLTELAKLNDKKNQEILKKIFPSHKLGDTYRLPTDEEWEYTARLGGLAEGAYSHAATVTMELKNYVFFRGNSDGILQPIGTKKPVFYNGKPLYDLNGNVNQWVYLSDKRILSISGIDPKSENVKLIKMNRGGSWRDSADRLRNTSSAFTNSEVELCDVGFRIVREAKE
jgi:formylglycine-generating enzyme required for sulfatase activity